MIPGIDQHALRRRVEAGNLAAEAAAIDRDQADFNLRRHGMFIGDAIAAQAAIAKRANALQAALMRHNQRGVPGEP